MTGRCRGVTSVRRQVDTARVDPDAPLLVALITWPVVSSQGGDRDGRVAGVDGRCAPGLAHGQGRGFAARCPVRFLAGVVAELFHTSSRGGRGLAR